MPWRPTVRPGWSPPHVAVRLRRGRQKGQNSHDNRTVGFDRTARGASDDVFPVLPLRDIVVFPHMIVPLFVGREKSIRALEEVMRADKQILLATQQNPSDDDPDARRRSSTSARWPPCCSS